MLSSSPQKIFPLDVAVSIQQYFQLLFNLSLNQSCLNSVAVRKGMRSDEIVPWSEILSCGINSVFVYKKMKKIKYKICVLSHNFNDRGQDK